MHIQYYFFYYLFCGTGRWVAKGGEREREETEQRARACGDHEGDEFLLDTISAPGFPLVYPEVNNWWEDKSVCEGEWDIQTRGENPARAPSTMPPISLSLAPRRLVAPSHRPLGRALEVQICVLTCSWLLSACFPLVSGDWLGARLTLVPGL